jgi:hypothetical protein
MLNFIKIRLMRSVLFHVVEQTDRQDEANSSFSHFCEGAN